MFAKGQKQDWAHGRKGRGEAFQWIKNHLDYQGEDCLKWPFAMDAAHGRGRLGHNGKMHWAHRLMCEMAHGPAPFGKPQAAHTCGNGDKGCVNPRHLDWKSNSENQLDRRVHGTSNIAKGTRTHLTKEQVGEIRALRGRMTQFKIAAKFGIKRSSVEYWQRTTHDPLPPGTSRDAIRRRMKKVSA